MFGFLKDKLKKTIEKFTKDVEKEVEEEIIETKVEKTDNSKKTESKPDKESPKPEKELIKEKPKENTKPEVKKEKHPIKVEKDESDIISKEESKPSKEEKEEVSTNIAQSEEIIEKIDEENISNEEIIPIENIEKINTNDDPNTENVEEKKGFFGKLKQAFSTPKEEEEITETISEDKPEISSEVIKETKEEPKKESSGFFSKITDVVTKKTLSEDKFDDLFFELEITLLENNVALEVIEKIKDDMKKNLLSEKVSRMKTEQVIAESLHNSLQELFDVEKVDIFKEAESKKPFVICFIGVNGSGKTTNLAKVANMIKEKGKGVVIAACDTFRAAAIQQIENHANKIGVKLIKHDYGADAAAVAFDAIEHAKAKGLDFVLIDTAGRNHSNTNLMDELQKVIRISKPDMKIFVGDSLTGNDTVEQAKTFNEKVGLDAIILSKVDVDEKGGAAISISYVTKKPIIFIGNGQEYDKIEEFSKEKILDTIGL